MAILKLCRKDPLIRTLREVFGNNIIRVPEERYRPLTVLAARKGKALFRGKLGPLFTANISFPQSIITKSRMADLSGTKTRSVKIKLGLNILGGFLEGMGVPSASVSAEFEGATEVSFTFHDVNRHWIDSGVVGRMLIGKKINPNNPAAKIFFGEDAYPFLVLDSVITSSDFTISVEEAESTGFGLDVPAIQAAVTNANASVSVSTSSKYDLTFKGSKDLAFAFSCVRFTIYEDGTIDEILPPDNEITLDYKLFITREIDPEDVEAEEESTTLYSPDRILLTKDPSMVEIE